MPVEARSGHGNYTEVLLPLKGGNSCGQSSVGAARIFFKYINGKRQCKNIISPFQDGDGHLTDRERDKAEVFSTSFVCLQCGSQNKRVPVSWRTMTVTVINSQST